MITRREFVRAARSENKNSATRLVTVKPTFFSSREQIHQVNNVIG